MILLESGREQREDQFVMCQNVSSNLLNNVQVFSVCTSTMQFIVLVAATAGVIDRSNFPLFMWSHTLDRVAYIPTRTPPCPTGIAIDYTGILL